MYYLKLNRNFPPYYVKALHNVFGSDEKNVKAHITSKWLHHLKKLVNSLTCVKRTTLVIKNKSPVETCIRRNIAQSLSLLLLRILSLQLIQTSWETNYAETRLINFLKMNRKFPTYYIEALCNVLGDDEKEVKEYIIKRWLDHSKNLIDSLACTTP
ncbi:hypothetical protein Bca4012_073461 [Brassica carinata]|uniref:Uncharacterized protein n=1 Tax=Brassica carinata TaxID=52824 RepID=A0A8X7QJ03_BRACI|nr:hypothetical protein Bca52824_065775 [Brassica carinata]